MGSLLEQLGRDPAYEYGDILPFRKPIGSHGIGAAEWGLGYSNTVKGLTDMFMMPGRAAMGQQISPQQGVEFGLGLLGTGGAIPSKGGLGINTWHGSPYHFDAFDLAKIGTGEGAQVYGHGIYLAEAPGAAKHYIAKPDAFTGHKLTPKGEALLDNIMREYKAYKEPYKGWLEEQKKTQEYNLILKYKNNPNLVTKSKGNLYKVDLPDEHIEKMLDWDKPLSEQPKEIQDLWEKIPHSYSPSKQYATGGDFYKDLSVYKRGKDKASAYLNSLGIPGIKYKAGQISGYAGPESSNFVIFDPSIVKITGKE